MAKSVPGISLLIGVSVLPFVLFTPGCTVFPSGPDYERHSSEEHTDFGVVYEEARDFRAAKQQYRRAVRKDAANHVAWTNLGNIHVRAKRFDRAREAYRQALALRPGYGPAVNNLATTYLDAPDPAPAMAVAIINAHLPLAGEEHNELLQETLARASDHRNPVSN